MCTKCVDIVYRKAHDTYMSNTATATKTARNLDPFQTFTATTIKGSDLTIGTIILDELDTPIAVIIDRISQHDFKCSMHEVLPGSVCFELFNVETGEIQWNAFGKTSSFKVAA